MKLAQLTLIFLVSGCYYAAGQPLRAPDRTNDRNQILRSIETLSSAYVARVPEPFEKLYLDNYVSIRGRPVFNSKEQLIAMITADRRLLDARKKLAYDTISYEAENPQFHFYGQAAVLNISKKNYWQYRGQKCMTRSQGTELWIRRDGEWKIAASHVTSFHCDPKPYYPVHSAVAAVGSITRPPLNSDAASEQQVRDMINSIVKARISTDEPFEAVLDRDLSEDFVFTNIQGEQSRDRSVLKTLPAASGSRSTRLRNQDDAIVVFDGAAIFTYKLKPEGPGEIPRQCSIFLAKAGERWLIVAAHLSQYSAE